MVITIQPILQEIVADKDFESLPTNWNLFDVRSFSKSKKLYDFQQEAIKNALKALYLYYKEEDSDKKRFYDRYVYNGLDFDLSLKATRSNKRIFQKILSHYYPPEEDRVRFENFINRMAFWMATGSGKTLVIVKLVAILKRLMDLREIPKRDILILTHREDLIKQLKRHVNEFNELTPERGVRISLKDLREYEYVKRESLSPFLNEFTIFYYRSDLIGEEQKENILDFRNYDNDGKWYIILDEAHKGDKEESKRQMFYSILSRDGFLFNFSATFTDPRDIVTTVFNFNLNEFVREGYGKHIYILKQEMRAFREKEDFNREEKQKIVLKALMLLTYIKKFRQKIWKTNKNVYHEPMLLTLVNTVNLRNVKKEKPDLKLFFNEIERIGKGELNEHLLEEAKDDLWREFSENPKLVYEDNLNLEVERAVLEEISLRDVLRYVYNSESFGAIEVLTIPSRRQEVIFKLKTSEKPFALIKIGDAVRWIKDNLPRYEVTEAYKDESIFENIDENPAISILMGSRAFYEGWDSNRPNVICFINIGVGRDAKKFVIQSTGRGVRIEPLKDKRKRLRNLYNINEDESLFEKLRDHILSIETLFVFGTKRGVLKEIISTLRLQKGIEEELEFLKNELVETLTLLIPIYKKSTRKVYEERDPQKFQITQYLFSSLKGYINYVKDDRVLLMLHDLDVDALKAIKESLENPERYYSLNGGFAVPIEVAIQKVSNHLNEFLQELDRFKILEDEIVHFKKIKIMLENGEELVDFREKINKVMKYEDPEVVKKELKEKYERGELTVEELISETEKKLADISQEEKFRDLRIKHLANHYYIPIVLSEIQKANYIKHIIKTRSEVEFVKKLENYLSKHITRLKEFDWWMFCKIDEHLDEVYIPYYDPNNNVIRKFKPDFVFWLQRGNDYFIVFIDPKGIQHTEFEHKVDSFERIFGDISSPKIKNFEKHKIRVLLFLFTGDRNRPSGGYGRYWYDNMDNVLETIVKISS